MEKNKKKNYMKKATVMCLALVKLWRFSMEKQKFRVFIYVMFTLY